MALHIVRRGNARPSSASSAYLPSQGEAESAQDTKKWSGLSSDHSSSPPAHSMYLSEFSNRSSKPSLASRFFITNPTAPSSSLFSLALAQSRSDSFQPRNRARPKVNHEHPVTTAPVTLDDKAVGSNISVKDAVVADHLDDGDGLINDALPLRFRCVILHLR